MEWHQKNLFRILNAFFCGLSFFGSGSSELVANLDTLRILRFTVEYIYSTVEKVHTLGKVGVIAYISVRWKYTNI